MPSDDGLIGESAASTGPSKRRHRPSYALTEDVKRRKQLRILKAFGTFDFDPTYDYKVERTRS